METHALPTIFIVEDDPFYMNVIKQELKNMKYPLIRVFEKGRDCILNLYQQPDIVILDHTLEDTNGLEVLKEIKSVNPDTFVIFLSGQENMNIAIKALKYGAFDYVVKDEKSFEKIRNLILRIRKLNRHMEETEVFQNRFKWFALASVGVLGCLVYIFLKNAHLFSL